VRCRWRGQENSGTTVKLATVEEGFGHEEAGLFLGFQSCFPPVQSSRWYERRWLFDIFVDVGILVVVSIGI
jgi:hypothetical protein